MGEAIAILRLTGLFFTLLMVGLVFRLVGPRGTFALIVANPFFYFYYVLEAHNDVIPVALVMLATVICAARPLIASIVAGLAIGVKAAFFPLALLAFANDSNQRRTFTRPMLICIAVGLLITLSGGMHYWGGLVAHGVSTGLATHSPRVVATTAIHVGLALVALIAIALAVWRGKYYLAASFSFIAISAQPYPQYLGWGVPYAWRTGFAAAFFIALPAVAAFMNSDSAARIIELVVLVCAILTYALRKRYPLAFPLTQTRDLESVRSR
ncbi:MAG: hypothetical protein JO165_11255 [Candidatus Eremiobacteraeota bacterium]|nr:hypothetical protein [Candidatus Eremiobacteraeota bacterium]